jgi:hypothetical protein
LPEQTAGISEFNSKNFIKIEQEINSGQFIIFEKLVLAKINDPTEISWNVKNKYKIQSISFLSDKRQIEDSSK